MHIGSRFPWRSQAGWLALLVVGCTTYEPQVELWPGEDAASLTPTGGGTGGSSTGDNSSSSGVGTGSGNGGTGSSSNGGGTGSGNGGGGPSSGSSSGGGGGGGGNGSSGVSGSSSSSGGHVGSSTGVGSSSSSGGGSGSSSGSGGGSSSGSSASGSSSGGTSTTCSLSASLLTVTDNGSFSPKNVGAIWVATNTGTFVKSLDVWAKTRISELKLWNTDTSAASLSRNVVDAITGATLSTHQTHNVTWNCADTKEVQVPDGTYRLYMEFADDNSAGPNNYVTFTKGPTAQTTNPANVTNFINIKLVFTP